tara:strand:+ start:198 stop:392 length:195 start_codon:yes stop_codon:yes gene_type:complete
LRDVKKEGVGQGNVEVWCRPRERAKVLASPPDAQRCLEWLGLTQAVLNVKLYVNERIMQKLICC